VKRSKGTGAKKSEKTSALNWTGTRGGVTTLKREKQKPNKEVVKWVKEKGSRSRGMHPLPILSIKKQRKRGRRGERWARRIKNGGGSFTTREKKRDLSLGGGGEEENLTYRRWRRRPNVGSIPVEDKTLPTSLLHPHGKDQRAGGKWELKQRWFRGKCRDEQPIWGGRVGP